MASYPGSETGSDMPVPMLSPYRIAQNVQALRALMAQPVVLNRVEQPSEMNEEIGKIAQEGLEEKMSDEVFSNYKHSEMIPGCQPHPGDIVEAGSLSAISLPPATYNLADVLPTELVTAGTLSSLQLEGIVYACQRHQQILPSGSRAGFFIGDGAGVGKGRQIAGIILDNFGRGRTKHIWFSISADLIVDARRDLQDIGCFIKVIEGCQQLDRETKVFGLPAGFKEGVLFSTYATLVSSVQKGGPLSTTKQSRLKQLVDWCGGENFDGCLIFDECHKAKNFVPGKEHASTKVALAVATVQKTLPKARVVYCSATGVTDVKNMAFMERLGLWGDGAPFKSFEQFLETVHRKGLGVAEMLAMEMKSSGMYVSRGLSFKQAEFVTVEAALSDDQIKMFDTAAHVWNELRKALESAMARTYCTNVRMWSQFWSSHQRFFKQLCMGLKVPVIVKEAKQALEDGCCVVIGLQTTGEASLEHEISKGASLTGFVSLCREILSRFIDQYFPTTIDGATDVDGKPVEDSWSVTAKNMLKQFAQKISLPDSPLDEIIDKLGGPECVAEMTGRRGRVVRRSHDDTPHYELRAAENVGAVDSLNVTERNFFMEGKKFVAIISDAASTGISLHADLRAPNQRRRVHLTIELPWSADKAVQQLGRSHRSNQSSGPLYKLVTTNLGGERRFAAAVARRLQSLGALTKGDRRAATGADLTEFNFDTPYGRGALRAMYHAICARELAAGVALCKVCPENMDFGEFNNIMQECLVLMGMLDVELLRSGAQIKDSEAGDVGRFLNRILGLGVKKQNLIFTYFTECLDSAIQAAKTEGRYNEGMLDIMASSVKMVGEPKQVFKEAARGNSSTKHVALIVDRGMSWEMALKRLSNHSGKNDGFYMSRRETRGKRLYLLATQKENSSHVFKIARPNTGVSAFDEERADLNAKYLPIQKEKAEESWREQYEESQQHCIHGPNCRTGVSCTVGTRCYKLHLLCGGIVTLMSLLESTITRHAGKFDLSKTECTLRVVRVALDNGERIVGIRYPQCLIPLAEEALREQKIIENMRQTQMVLQNGVVVTVPVPQNPVQNTVTVIEPETPVNRKTLTKALTPPVTIKNFFKPTAKPDNNTQENSENQDNSENSESSTSKSVKHETKSANLKVKGAVDENSSPKHNPLTATNKGIKRTASSSSLSSSVAKKPKQSSIMASFVKQTVKQEEKKIKALTCPICNIVFEQGTTNQDLNTHIDNCIL